MTSGGISALRALKNGLLSGSSMIHISPTNPANYAFAGGGNSGGTLNISLSISMDDILQYAMTLTKAEQAALGITIAASATGGAIAGDGTSGDEGDSGIKAIKIKDIPKMKKQDIIKNIPDD